MKFTKQYPRVDLRPYVKSYWIMQVHRQDLPFSQLFFPYGAFELVYYLENPGLMQYVGETRSFFQPVVSYSGQFTRPFKLSFTQPCKCIGISLNPWAGGLLYNTPAQLFTNAMVELADLETSDLLTDKISPSASDQQIFNALENYVAKKIDRSEFDPVSLHLARASMQESTRCSMNTALNSVGLSRRRIEQRFLRSTGLSLGAFTKKVRFQRAITLLKSGCNINSLTQISCEAGYYDQSHFIREFKEFAAITPGAFLKQNSEFKDFLVELV